MITHDNDSPGCFLCDIVARGVGKPMRALFPRVPLRHEVLASTDRYAMILDVAPIVEGHSLVIPKHHTTAFALEPPAVADELGSFVQRCENAVKRAYGVEPVLFEHGSSSLDGTHAGCCITHAHLHIVPISTELLRPDESSAFRPLPSFDSLLQIEQTKGDYLLYKGPDRTYRIADAAGVQSQHFRRRMAEVTGEELWNWLDFVLLCNANDTRRRLVEARIKLEAALGH